MRRAAVLLLLCATAGRALADDGEVRHMRFGERDGNLIMTGSFTDLFTQDLLDQLSNGFTTTIVVRAYLYAAGETVPVAEQDGELRVVYDLWDEVYLVQVTDPLGERNLRESSRAEALRDATTLVEFPVCPMATMQAGKSYYVGLVALANPVSADLLAEVRRWLLRSGGSIGSDSFFGSFVSVFVNPHIDEADRTLRFRSQLITPDSGASP
jgi:hypothetical protein